MSYIIVEKTKNTSNIFKSCYRPCTIRELCIRKVTWVPVYVIIKIKRLDL